MFQDFMEAEYNFDKCLMSDTDTLNKIHAAKFDLIFGDAMSIMTNLLASHLDITTVLYLNVLAPFESRLFFPFTPSITCVITGVSCNANDNGFIDRLQNFLTYGALDLFWDNIYSNVQQFAKEFNFSLRGPLREALKNKVTVINMDFVLDTPLPTMPHIFPISGLFHAQPSPLTKEFSDIIKSSEPHGVILLSFGTLMPEFDAVKADMFAKVLGRLQQSVIWRFTGLFFFFFTVIQKRLYIECGFYAFAMNVTFSIT